MSFTVEVVCATSLDGKISTADRKPWRWSDPEDHEWLLSRMAAADLLVTGAGTIRSEDPTVLLPESWAERRQEDGRTPQPPRLIITPSLSISPGSRVAKSEAAELLVAAAPAAIETKAGSFRPGVTWIAWTGRVRPALEEACRATDAGRIVCLGGGRTNAALLEEDLVDRVSLTISAFVIGDRGAPGPFDGEGFEPFPRFRLAGAREAGRDFILRYERDRGADGRSATHGLE